MQRTFMRRKLSFSIIILVLVFLFFAIGAFFHHYPPRGNGPVILMYHHLAPAGTYDNTTEEGNGAILSVEHFEEQMKWLQEQGFHTMKISELAPYLKENRPIPDKTVLITFDDGYESNYVYAYPILKKYGLQANLAVVVKSTEEREAAADSSAYNPQSLRHLTYAQLKEMSESGIFEIGSHSFDGHGNINVNEIEIKPFFVNKKYNTLTREEETDAAYQARIYHDLMTSKTLLEEHIGQTVQYFAYPYGRHNEDVVAALQKAGFQFAVTTTHGSIQTDTDPFLLPRYNVDENMTLEEFAKLVNYEMK